MTQPLPACPPGRLAALLTVLALIPSAARAQDDPRLRDALRLAQEGGSDSARAVVNGLLRTTPLTDSLYPQMVYTLGLVSRSVEEMRRNYTRVAVEFTNSTWADDALYRLGLLDYASGNVAAAIRQMDRIRSDYPDSPLIPTAAEWAARALFDQRKPREACDWLAAALSRSAQDIELRNRLEFMNGRCLNPPPADTARPDTVKPQVASAPRTGFAVQIGAVNTQAAADKLADDLKSAGFTSYIVKDSKLLKVRTGPYPDRARAQAAAARVRSKLGGSPFVVKEP